MRRLIRLMGLAALFSFVVGCGPSERNANGTNTGPPVKGNVKGPPPMNGPGEGIPKRH